MHSCRWSDEPSPACWTDIDLAAQVFGYSILTILFQSRASFGINAFFGKGVLGLIQAFIFNW
jgi:hypothetical protein